MHCMTGVGRRGICNTLVLLLATGIALATATTAFAADAYYGPAKNVYRFQNIGNQAYFYTFSNAEYWNLRLNLAGTYRYDGIGWTAIDNWAGTPDPLHRFYNPTNHTHFYTADPAEKASLMGNPSYQYDGISHYVGREQAYNASGDTYLRPVYRFLNISRGTHLYTADESEKSALMGNSAYRYEGTAFWVLQDRWWPHQADPKEAITWLAPKGWTYLAPYNHVYNCEAFALGRTDTWLWPWWAQADGSPVTEREMDDEMAYYHHDRTIYESEATIIAYGYSGNVLHVAKKISTTKTESKNGQAERFRYPSLRPYTTAAGSYGGIRRMYK